MVQSRNYTIIDFNSDLHEIVVRFNQFDDSRKIKLPIEDNKYITGDLLDNYIMSFCPVREILIPKVVTNAEEIEKLVSYKYAERRNKAIARNDNIALRNSLLSSSDWTQLPDANATLDDEDKLLWAKYRQDLRDLTKQKGWPFDVNWPKRPHILGVTIFE